MKFTTNSNLNGQSQCFGCKQKGIWNVEWSCMMFKCDVNGKHYCYKCKCELLKAKYALLKNRTNKNKNNKLKYKDELHNINIYIVLGYFDHVELNRHIYLRKRGDGK